MAIVNITTVSDADFVRAFSYKMLNGETLEPFDLTGAKMRMGVRKHLEDREEQLVLTTENGGIVIYDADGGLFYITIRQSQLLDLAPGEYVHSLIRIMEFNDQDFRYRVWSGTLIHSIGPSREGQNV